MLANLRRRIALPYAALILLLALGLGVLFNSTLRQRTVANLQEQLASQATVIGDDYRARLATQGDAIDPERLAEHWSAISGVRVTLIAPQGIVLGDSSQDPALMDNHATRPEVLDALAYGYGSSQRLSHTTGIETVYVAIPAPPGGSPEIIVRLALPLNEVEARMEAPTQAQIWITLAALSIALGLAIWITRPVGALADAVETLAAGSLGQRQPETGALPGARDELDRLRRAFDTVSAALNAQTVRAHSAQDKLAAVFAGISDGALIVNPQGEVELANPAARKLLDLPSQEIIQRRLAAVVRHHLLVELWQRCQQDGNSHEAMIEIAPRRLYLQATAAPLGDELPCGVLLLLHNLTRQRFLETVRRDFVSNISHELRTPLASLKALTETLQDGALEDPPAAKRFLGRMEDEVDSLAQMVSELLELSRIESGRVPMQITPASPAKIIARAVERLQMQAERAGLQVTLNVPPDLPHVPADAGRLVQVLVNLLHNAIKFTPPGGQIVVAAEHQPASGAKAERVVFSVQDNGAGIPATDLPRIFERFYKADRARTSGGTGLGLAIARHTIEAHQGEIWVESVEGRGSTFFFSIPLPPTD